MDRAVDAEARAGRVRRFKLSTGADDYAVMLTADYVQEASLAANRGPTDTESSSSGLVFSSQSDPALPAPAAREMIKSSANGRSHRGGTTHTHTSTPHFTPSPIPPCRPNAPQLDRARASFGTSATAPAGSSAANASAIEIAEAELALIGERRASAASAAQAAAPAPAVPGGARGGSGGGRERSATPPPGEAQAGGAGSRAAAGPSSAAGAGKGGEPSPFDLFRDRVLPHAFGLSVTQVRLPRAHVAS